MPLDSLWSPEDISNISLEVECHIPLLFIHRKKLLISYLTKLKELPSNLNITKLQIYDVNSPYTVALSGNTEKLPSVTTGKNYAPNP